MTPCLHCKAPIPRGPRQKLSEWRRQKYCSRKCHFEHRKAKSARSDRRCEECNSPIIRKRYPSGELEAVSAYERRRYCCKPCEMKHRTIDMGVKHCLSCGVRMERKRMESGQWEPTVNFARKRYCSRACVNRMGWRDRRRKDLRTRWLRRRYVPFVSDAVGSPRPGNGAGAGVDRLEAAE